MPINQSFQYPLKQSGVTFIEKDLESLLLKKVTVSSEPEQGEFVSQIFIREKPDGATD